MRKAQGRVKGLKSGVDVETPMVELYRWGLVGSVHPQSGFQGPEVK